MIFKKFRFAVISKVLMLSAAIAFFIYILIQTDFVVANVFLGVIIIYFIVNLILFVETTNKDLARFLEAIEFSDFSQSFGHGYKGRSFADLSKAFNLVSDKFLKIRSQKEEHFQYMQTVMKHVGTGLISFRENESIELINNAACSILNTPPVKQLKSLDRGAPGMYKHLLNLKPGDHKFLKLIINGKPAQLTITATAFKLLKTHYTLVSLQNIQSEVENERMTRELEIARDVQQKLIPKYDFKHKDYDFAGLCLPAKEVGGDYYDIISMGENKTGFVIADVSGKGMAAAIYMTLTKGIIQAHINENSSPINILIKLNHLLYNTIERGYFVSLIFAVYDRGTRQITCARAGHNPLLFYESRQKKLHEIKPEGLALGLDNNEIFNSTIEEQSFILNANDFLVFYTDGFTEAMNAQREEYGEDRLNAVIENNGSEKAENLLQAIYKDVEQHMGETPHHDDMTMMVFKI